MSDYTSWHVGMKVCCVKTRGRAALPGETHPVCGGVYTIRTVSVDHAGHVGIRLAEITNPQNTDLAPDNTGSHEIGWYASSFRPVMTRKTCISIFTALLTPSPKQRERV